MKHLILIPADDLGLVTCEECGKVIDEEGYHLFGKVPMNMHKPCFWQFVRSIQAQLETLEGMVDLLPEEMKREGESYGT